MGNDKKISLLFKGADNLVPEYKDGDYYKKKIQEDNKKMKEFLDDFTPDFLETSGLIRKKKDEE